MGEPETEGFTLLRGNMGSGQGEVTRMYWVEVWYVCRSGGVNTRMLYRRMCLCVFRSLEQIDWKMRRSKDIGVGRR